MRLRFVDHVVHPTLRLLYAQLPPLRLAHQAVCRHKPGKVLRQDDVAVLIDVVVVLVAVQNLALQLFDNNERLPLAVGVQ